MKKIIFISLISLIVLSQSQAQSGGKAYEIGDKYIHAGLSFGAYGLGYVGTRTGISLPIYVSGEYGFHEYISAGAFLGFVRYSYKYDYIYSYKFSWTYVSMGARGTFHFSPLLNEHLDLNVDLTKLDFYLSMIAGIRIQNYSYEGTYTYGNYGNSVAIIFRPFLGAKYMINNNLGVFVEGGATVNGFGSIGISLRF